MFRYADYGSHAKIGFNQTEDTYVCLQLTFFSSVFNADLKEYLLQSSRGVPTSLQDGIQAHGLFAALIPALL
jgi:hypothetical protein